MKVETVRKAKHRLALCTRVKARFCHSGTNTIMNEPQHLAYTGGREILLSSGNEDTTRVGFPFFFLFETQTRARFVRRQIYLP